MSSKKINFLCTFLTLCFLVACSSKQSPIFLRENDSDSVFILIPDGFDHQTENIPKLIVQLSILTQTSVSGQKERFGKATFYWSDLDPENGGSTLTGTVSARLRKVNSTATLTEVVNAPVTTNLVLYSQPGYTNHLVYTPVTNLSSLCLEVTEWDLITTKGLSFNQSKPITYCQSNTVLGADMEVKLQSHSITYTEIGAEAVLVMAIQNLGPRVAISPKLTLLLPPNVTFNRSISSKFKCTSLTISVVECLASSDNYGPGTQDLPIYLLAKSVGVGVVHAIQSTLSTDPDTSNNIIDINVETVAENIPNVNQLTSNDIWITEEDTLILTAIASNESEGISRIEFYEDDNLIGDYNNTSNISSPFRVKQDIPLSFIDNGLHSYSIKAYDLSGNLTTPIRPVEVNVDIGDSSQCQGPVNEQPNVILIVTDDQSYDDIAYMPFLQQHLITQGTSFQNAFVAQPFCCPSRASILRGQYPHNHGLQTNVSPTGGFPKFFQMGLETSTIATELKNNGYYTALMGKYLNVYPGTSPSQRVVDETYIPPGWDEWVALLYEIHFFDYKLNKNGIVRSYGHSQVDYHTDVLSRAAQGFIKRRACEASPFFLYLSPFAPHSPLTPAERHKTLFSELQAPRLPSFNEADVNDKPSFMKGLLPLTTSQINTLDIAHRGRIRLLKAVDEMLNDTVAVLESKGISDNTIIIFTSDNGYHLGQHRLLQGKFMPYEEDIHVPLIIKGPNVPLKTVDDLVLNIDIAPTIAAYAGITFPSFMDGKSLIPLLDDFPENDWRQSILVQGWNSNNGQKVYSTIRTKTKKYTEWFYSLGRVSMKKLPVTEYEVYDLVNDPYELNNIFSTLDPNDLQNLKDELTILQQCRGASCP